MAKRKPNPRQVNRGNLKAEVRSPVTHIFTDPITGEIQVRFATREFITDGGSPVASTSRPGDVPFVDAILSDLLDHRINGVTGQDVVDYLASLFDELYSQEFSKLPPQAQGGNRNGSSSK